MAKLDVDSHGRIYLPKKLREEYGESFRVVPFKRELKLIPIPEDPVEDLRERTRALRDSDKTVEELKEAARKELSEMAGE